MIFLAILAIGAFVFVGFILNSLTDWVLELERRIEKLEQQKD